MTDLQAAKRVSRAFDTAVDCADPDGLAAAIAAFTGADYRFRTVWPWRELNGTEAVASQFWAPLRAALRPMQRREDIFFAGENGVGTGIWTLSMGHFMGLLDAPWLGIAPTGRLAMLRYAQFHRIDGECVAETALFIDLIGLMAQAGQYPLPPQTGADFVYPGPRTHDGILLDDHPPQAGRATLDLVGRMVDDLQLLNESGAMDCPPDVLRRTWHEDMLWYGPSGIGATYTIERYQQQHQLPFRAQLTDKRFEGHVCRIAEGNYCAFFGWPNLSNTNAGGFMGLPAGRNAAMQVVDVYRRDGDKLAENWVLIDLPWWLHQQGLDVLQRNRQLRGEIGYGEGTRGGCP